MYQPPPGMRLRRPLPTGKTDFIILSFPLAWAIKRNTGMTEPIPEAFNKAAFWIMVQTVKGMTTTTVDMPGTSSIVKPESGRDFIYPENLKPDQTAFSVVDLFWRDGAGRNPGNHPVYQALVGTAIMRGITRADTFKPLEIRNMVKSLNLQWGDRRIDFEIDRLLAREEMRPCLLERDPISGEWRFPLQAWLEVPIIEESEILARKAQSYGLRPTLRGGRPRMVSPIEEALADGPMTTADLIYALRKRMVHESVGVTLTRLKRAGRVVHLQRGTWALPVDKSAQTEQEYAITGAE